MVKREDQMMSKVPRSLGLVEFGVSVTFLEQNLTYIFPEGGKKTPRLTYALTQPCRWPETVAFTAFVAEANVTREHNRRMSRCVMVPSVSLRVDC